MVTQREIIRVKVALISSNCATTPYPVYPLGMSVVAQALAAAGHTPLLFDLLMANESVEACAEWLAEVQPELVGVSLRNIDNVNLLNERRYIDVVGELVTAVKKRLGAPVVLGGSGFSLLPDRLLAVTGADYGIVGEAEEQIVDLVGMLSTGTGPTRGTILRGRCHLDGSAIRGALYDPAIMSRYHEAGGVAAIQSKRGCMLKCTYCSYPQLEGPIIRARPATHVVDEIEQLLDDHGCRYIFFADSVFNDGQGHYLEVLHEMKRRRLAPPWSAFIKPTDLDESAVALMKETGMFAAELGSDAASDATLRGLAKPFNWQTVTEASERLLRHRICVAHYFMFGGPGETRDTLLEGIDNIRDLQCTAAFVFLGIRILPDTRLYDRAIREGVVAPDQDLLNPVYYLSPQIDRMWMETTLAEAFEPLPHVIYPPDAMDDKLQLLHKLGYAGSLWNMLNPL